MTWVGGVAAGSWLAASAFYAFGRRKAWYGDVLTMLGVALGAIFLATLWMNIGRPPLRTLGETRWWYAVLVPLIGLLVGWRFQTRLLAIPAVLMGATFAGINLLNPEIMDRTLMPALQSGWFVPHVVVYMVAYAALGLSGLMAAYFLVRRLFKIPIQSADADAAHRLVLIGFPFLTCGLVFGAFWAKEAWGHYWTWDPKETWAMLTWGCYLTYIHVRLRHALKPVLNLAILAIGFGVLLACWFGLNLMPIANESVHTYSRQ